MVRPKREAQSNLGERIKDVAYQQIAANGAAALSLRAIARELNVTAPAIYNYYARRDDLVTALIVDSYNSIADALQKARAAAPGEDYAAQLRGALLAYRAWASDHPERYNLIFGTPIPNYHAPKETTLPAATRSMDTIIDILENAEAAEALNFSPLAASPSDPLREALLSWQGERGYCASIQILYLTISGWGRIHGLVMLEITHHLAPFFYDVDALYQAEVDLLLQQAGLK
jgi:AcrR family transcriptional regulator